MPVRLSTCVSAAQTGGICVKFDIGDFYEERIQFCLKSGQCQALFKKA